LTNPAFVQTLVRGRPSRTRCPDQRTWLRGRCPPGGALFPATAGAARAVLPPYAARAGQPSNLPLNRPPPAAGASGPNRRRSHRGRYHTDRQPGDAAQYTARSLQPEVPAAASERGRAVTRRAAGGSGRPPEPYQEALRMLLTPPWPVRSPPLPRQITHPSPPAWRPAAEPVENRWGIPQGVPKGGSRRLA
jgi:hypothetical protein